MTPHQLLNDEAEAIIQDMELFVEVTDRTCANHNPHLIGPECFHCVFTRAIAESGLRSLLVRENRSWTLH